jgi:hypothetical protein
MGLDCGAVLDMELAGAVDDPLAKNLPIPHPVVWQILVANGGMG